VGPRVTGGDGRLQRTCRRLPTLWNTTCRTLALDRVLGSRPMFAGYELTAADHESLRDVEVLSGCFCLVRRAAVEAVGGLDEQFFFYGEDIDWCKRLRQAGWRVVFVPEATATHFGGGSTSNAPLRYSVEILNATLKYWRKHHGMAAEAACFALLVAHHALRLALRGLLRGAGSGTSAESRQKLREDAVCLRWLLTRAHPQRLTVSAQGRELS
jgi:GT2 family glycosyltransferase